jgi:hypothetical protein
MQTSTQPDSPERKTFARFLPPIARILLALILLFFGLNGFLQFMPPPRDMPQDLMKVTGALMQAGYLQVVSGTQVLVGLLLLINRFVPLALALFAPIIVGIITFHIRMAPSTIAPGIVVLILELYLAWAYRDAFRPMLKARVSHGVK